MILNAFTTISAYLVEKYFVSHRKVEKCLNITRFFQTSRTFLQEQKFGYLFSALDQLILTIFICEVLLKWYGGFFTYWKVNMMFNSNHNVTNS